MALIPNLCKEKLKAGEIACGIGLRQARTVDIAKIAKVCGFDWLFIDMEHNTMGIDTAVQIAVAGLDAGVTPIVRVPGKQHFHATRVMDGGAQGVVVPHIDTPEEAAQVASNCRYPALGHRSLAGGPPQLEYESIPPAEMTKVLNENTLITVMLESPTAIENADAIAAVEGIDVLLIGTNDMCAEMGIPGEFGHDRVVDAYDKVVSACRNNGKFPGMGGIYSHDLMERYIKMGCQFLLSGSDISFLMAAAKQRTSFLKGLKR
ncbi:MAG: aldolase/citrate lyase family protein [Acetobacterales bacterium]